MSYVQSRAASVVTDKSGRKVTSRPSFFVQPLNRTRLTLLKAPMAHKTFSQEQYKFQSYNLGVTFNGRPARNIPSSVNHSIFAATSARNSDISMETNLLVLARFRLSFAAFDAQFMLLVR
jgi:hypothetical protein